jgi:hypothetical protein
MLWPFSLSLNAAACLSAIPGELAEGPSGTYRIRRTFLLWTSWAYDTPHCKELQMDDLEKLKKVASMLLSNLRGMDFDLTVYQAVFHTLAGAPTPERMQVLLHDARQNPDLRRAVLSKYEPIRIGLEQLEQKDADTALLEILKAWKPEGPEN